MPPESKLKTLSGEDFDPPIPGRLFKIASEIRAAGGRAFLVGGFVRDCLLGNADSRDYDVEVYGITQDVLFGILSKFGKASAVGKAFGVFHLATRGLSLDFSFPRTESKIGFGHRGFLVETHTNLSFKEAAYRRDFTVNAMGMELPSLELCDPYSGRSDLELGILRHVGPAFAEDSLRVLRGVQFASRFSLRLAPETAELCSALPLSDLSRERIFEELKKWLLKPGKPSLGLKAFLEIGLEKTFPEVKPLKKLDEESFELLGCFLDRVHKNSATFPSGEREILMFAALLFGASSGEALSFLERITNEASLLEGVPKLVQNALKILPNENLPGSADLRRLSVKLGGLALHATLLASDPRFEPKMLEEFVAALRAKAVELGIFERAPKPYLTGKFLLGRGVPQGKFVGKLIKASFELQLDGELKSIQEAEAWAALQLQKFTST